MNDAADSQGLPTAEERAPILAAIPHRPPFLFVDRIVQLDAKQISTEYRVRQDDLFVGGHYPGNPLMPGVLICEAILQAGAVLMAHLDAPDAAAPGFAPGVPVLSRLSDATFRRPVRPGELLEIEVELVERAGPAVQLRGRASVAGKVAVRAGFTTALVPHDRLA